MSEPNLDFDTFLTPISDDEPAGPVLYDVRQQLDEMRKEKEDPTNPGTVIKPNFRDVIRLAQDTLLNRSKDLIITTRLTEALMQIQGFGGLRDGLRLIRMLVEQCWERLNPPLDPEDPEVRALPFNWLCNPDQRPYFPGKVRMLQLFGTRDVPFSFRDFEQIQKKDDAERRQQLNEAIAATSTDVMRDMFTDISEAVQELATLDTLLTERMSGAQPSLDGLRAALNDCGHLLQENMPADSTVAAGAADPSSTPGTIEGGGGLRALGDGLGSVATRAEAYRQIGQIANLLRQIEPHSPIPYLLDKAVEWGGLSFPQLIAALVRDANVLGELNREFGIKDPSG